MGCRAIVSGKSLQCRYDTGWCIPTARVSSSIPTTSTSSGWENRSAARGATIVVEGLIAPKRINKTPKLPRKPVKKTAEGETDPPGKAKSAFVPPAAALAPLFRLRLKSIHECRRDFLLEISDRPTNRVLGGYYPRRSLIKLYTRDTETGRRTLDELFDTFLHEIRAPFGVFGAFHLLRQAVRQGEGRDAQSLVLEDL